MEMFDGRRKAWVRPARSRFGGRNLETFALISQINGSGTGENSHDHILLFPEVNFRPSPKDRHFGGGIQESKRSVRGR